jgi:hypothetical protein
MRIAALLLICATVCLAQLADNTVTVTVTRTVKLQPDQAALTITLTGPVTASLSDVVAALQPAGLTAEDLVSVRSFTDTTGSQLSWQFSKALAFSDLKSALPTFGGGPVQTGNVSPFSLTWFLQSQTSQAAQQAAVCPVPTLFADAQAQAQQIAAAAGVRIGGIVSMSQGGGPVIPAAVFRSGDFSQGVFVYDPAGVPPAASLMSILYTTSAVAGAGCSLTVQFQLLR